ncbi:chaperone modulator CbpM [Legionella sp. km772]|uniref:chaperone modulator CbpM n=1 Tax=Legionella sp. km772 TaxID=2498111 RepID=UPI000F8DFFF6|nr:chaperone modulator CbpM [Legionella sp. km772]RUR13746.1 molecular chaperone [Legionella sp. km772]
MNKEQVIVGMLIEETLSFKEVCHKYNIPQELLLEMMEYGIFSTSSNGKENQLDAKDLRRMESAFRLHRDLEINLPGVALALELLDEIEGLRRELAILHKHF